MKQQLESGRYVIPIILLPKTRFAGESSRFAEDFPVLGLFDLILEPWIVGLGMNLCAAGVCDVRVLLPRESRRGSPIAGGSLHTEQEVFRSALGGEDEGDP